MLAKRFHIKTGTAKFFSKEFVDTSISKSINSKFKLIYVGSEVLEDDIIEVSKKNKFSIYIPLYLTNQVKSLIDLSLAINSLLSQKDILSNQRVHRILQGMLNTNKNEIDKILDIKERLFYSGETLPYSSEKLQQTISQILTIKHRLFKNKNLT